MSLNNILYLSSLKQIYLPFCLDLTFIFCLFSSDNLLLINKLVSLPQLDSFLCICVFNWLPNWPINKVYVSNLNWQQIFRCQYIHVYPKSFLTIQFLSIVTNNFFEGSIVSLLNWYKPSFPSYLYIQEVKEYKIKYIFHFTIHVSLTRRRQGGRGHYDTSPLCFIITFFLFIG